MSFVSKWTFLLNGAFHFFSFSTYVHFGQKTICVKRHFRPNNLFGQIIFSAIWHFWPHVHFGQNDIFGQPTFVQRGFVLIVCSTKWHIRPNNIRSNGPSMSKILISTGNKKPSMELQQDILKVFIGSLLILRNFPGKLCGAHIYEIFLTDRLDGGETNPSISVVFQMPGNV